MVSMWKTMKHAETSRILFKLSAIGIEMAVFALSAPRHCAIAVGRAGTPMVL
ncbi:hypothetical protein AB7M70_001130 [Bradyrhizobium japonicum]